MKKVVVIGGGTGLAVIMRGLKTLPNVKCSAIVTVADDGGSTGRLRERYNIPAMGDIRNVLVAMSEDEGIFSQLMNHRFEGEEDIGGHNLGNLIITALTSQSGSFQEAITRASKFLNVKGEIIPSTLDVVTLSAKMADGNIIRGESNIPNNHQNIDEVFYDQEVNANKKALNAIKKADYIFFGIGSLYTSIIPNLIIEEIKQAIIKSKAKKIYICNAMTQPGETDDYCLEDHVNAIEYHLGQPIIDQVLSHHSEINREIIERYLETGSTLIKAKQLAKHYEIIEKDLLKVENKKVRHDHNKIAIEIMDIIKS